MEIRLYYVCVCSQRNVFGISFFVFTVVPKCCLIFCFVFKSKYVLLKKLKSAINKYIYTYNIYHNCYCYCCRSTCDLISLRHLTYFNYLFACV